jgi:hypothetical protein
MLVHSLARPESSLSSGLANLSFSVMPVHDLLVSASTPVPGGEGVIDMDCEHATVQGLQFFGLVLCNINMIVSEIEIAISVVHSLPLCSQSGKCVPAHFFGLSSNSQSVSGGRHVLLLHEPDVLLGGIDVFFLLFFGCQLTIAVRTVAAVTRIGLIVGAVFVVGRATWIILLLLL